jgi:hypothetical protein
MGMPPPLRRRCRALFGLLAFVATTGANGAEAPARWGDPRVVTLFRGRVELFRERGLEHLGSVELPRGWAVKWWLDAEHGRLGVVSREGLMKQKGPLQLSILDLETRRIVTSQPIEGSFHFMVSAEAGRIGFLSLLAEAKKGKSPTARLVRVDLAAGTLGAPRELAGAPSAMGLSSDERELVVTFAGASGKTRAARQPGRVEILGADDLAPRGVVTLPGPADAVFWNGDRSRLYVQDVGIDDARPEVALPGRLVVVDPKAAAAVAELELGIGPGPLGWDAERGVFYLLIRPRKAKDAEASLAVVRGAEIEREIALPARPVAVFPSADRSRFYVLEEKGITLVDGSLESIGGRIALSDTPTGILPLEESNRAFVSFAGSSQVALLDLGTRQLLHRHTTGRAGKKVALAAAAVLATTLSMANSAMLTGNQYALAQVVTYPSPQTSGFLSPDRRLAFFYNSQTGDYTVVDVESNRMVAQLAGTGIRFLEEGRRAAVMQVTDVLLWDVEGRRTLAEIDAGGGGKFVCPDGDHVWAVAGIHSLNVVDLAKQTVVEKFDELGGGLFFYDAAKSAPIAAAAPAE